ncbi:Carboxypeptidase A1 [Pyrenophora teres f. teres]|uniref:Carboxypeptidase A1 n=1 Tax=Pyrenophora teres f. teres TaxID=97479 RepID=A0A6S6VHY4_9PLEO|nr:Carboxypeptidase A1 [Pyrenophora teres f. teres]
MKYPNFLLLAAQLAVASSFHSGSNPITRDNGQVSYDGYHVYSITPSTNQAARELEQRFSNHYTHPIRNTLSVAIPPEEIDEFQTLGLDARLVNSDLGAYIRSAEKQPVYKRSISQPGELPDLSWFDTYHAYADHLQYWDDLVATFPNNTKKFAIGQSYENRTIWAFEFYGDEETKEEKPIILWHATVHAREWISTMVIEYLAHRLLSTSTNSTSNYLTNYTFYLVPFHNPDGFLFSQTSNRLWRKNRQPRPSINSTCLGTDGNRNWRYEWDAEPPEGGSTPNPCGQTYRGESPGDTPENAALDSLSARLAKQGPVGIRSFIDFHSYGQLILTPYGFSCDPLPETLPRMLEVAGGTAGAIMEASTMNSTYKFGPGCQILYFSTGNSRDHHYAVHGAEHSWTMELSPRDEAGGGFVLPPEFIWPVVREQWAGQEWLLGEVLEG